MLDTAFVWTLLKRKKGKRRGYGKRERLEERGSERKEKRKERKDEKERNAQIKMFMGIWQQTYL